MAYTSTCEHCKRPWVFHDDDKPPFYCDYCQGLWNEIMIAHEIIEGRWQGPLPGDEEEDNDG